MSHKRIEILEKVVVSLVVASTGGVSAGGERIEAEGLIKSAVPNALDFNPKLEILRNFENKEILEKYVAIAEERGYFNDK
jgi:hypothetical protein